MANPVIRPGNGLLLFALQSTEGVMAVPSATTDVVPCETDSVTYNMPYKTDATNEANGSFSSGAPVVVGQAATFSFRSRLKGAGTGVTYSATVKPPLHAPLSACGWFGVFTSALASTALASGTTISATLGSGASALAQAYRGQPLMLTGSPAAGRMPLITDYSAAKVAILSDVYGSALTVANTAAIPANWSYAPTSPQDAATRIAQHPLGTIHWYEDGIVWQFQDCRGTVDFEGDSAKPGFAVFSFTGIFVAKLDVALPTSAVYAGQSAPLLVQGGAVGPVAQVGRLALPISKWSLKNGGQIDSPEDPNTQFGYGPGQISDRTYVLEVDPLMTFVATRNSLADIAGFAQYPASFQFGAVAGNRVSLMMPVAQPTDSTTGMRGKLRSETLHLQALTPGRDAANRDGDVVLCFS